MVYTCRQERRMEQHTLPLLRDKAACPHTGPRAVLRPHRALHTGARKATPQPIERAATQQQELVANSAIMPHAHTALALCDADRLDVVLMHASGS
jgi:hypothetical protein